jgi:hypothetical protein
MSSSTTCNSPKPQDFDKSQSPALHTAKYAIFGFEITVAGGVTGTPRFLNAFSKSDTASREKNAYELSLGEKFIVVVTLLFFVKWLVASATKNIFTFVAVCGALWLAFGGHRCFEKEDVEGVHPEQTEDDKVPEWLRALRRGSGREVSLSDTYVGFETGKAVLDDEPTSAVFAGLSALPDLFVDCVDHAEVLAWMNNLPDNYDILSREEREAIFVQLCQLSDLFTEDTDHVEVLAWMNNLPGIFTSSLTEEYTGDVASAYETHNTELDISSSGCLEFLIHQHEYPTFNDNDLRPTAYGFDDLINPIIVADEAASNSAWTGVDSCPGRPVKADVADITYMYGQLEQHLPSRLANEIRNRTPEEWYMLRNHRGLNYLYEELVFQWSKMSAGPGVVETIEDVCRLVAMSRLVFTPECPVDMRNVCGVDADYRAYLTDQEVRDMDEGCADFCYEQHEQSSKVLSFLRDSKMFAKPKPHNPVLA